MREAVLPALRWTALCRPGAQALCMAPVTFLGALVVVAPSSLVIRGDAPRGGTRRATGLLVVLAGVATLAMVPASVAIAWSQDDPRTLPLCLALTGCVLWPHAVSAAWQASFERRLDFRAVSMVELAAGLASTVATVGCALGGAGVWALAVGAVAASATQFLLLIAALRGDALPSFDFRGLGRADAAYGGRVALGTLATQALEAAETFLLARFLGAPELGVWRTTRELVNVPMGKVVPIVNRVGFPAYARLGGDIEAARRYALLSLRVFAALFVPAYWGLAAVAPHVVPLAMGPQWTQAAPLAAIFGFFLPLRLLQYCPVLPHQGLGDAALVNRATIMAGGGGPGRPRGRDRPWRDRRGGMHGARPRGRPRARRRPRAAPARPVLARGRGRMRADPARRRRDGRGRHRDAPIAPRWLVACRGARPARAARRGGALRGIPGARPRPAAAPGRIHPPRHRAPAMRRVVVADSVVDGAEHAPFNAGMLAAIALALPPAKRLEFHAEAAHREVVLEALAPGLRARISGGSLPVRRAARDALFDRALLALPLAARDPPHRLVLLAAGCGTLASLALLGAAGRVRRGAGFAVLHAAAANLWAPRRRNPRALGRSGERAAPRHPARPCAGAGRAGHPRGIQRPLSRAGGARAPLAASPAGGRAARARRRWRWTARAARLPRPRGRG